MSSSQTGSKNLVTLEYERQLWATGRKRVAGVDEAGRGPLAGPVVAAAVIFPPGSFIPEVNDSKLLSPKRRERLYGQINDTALAIGVGVVDHTVIDDINILNATYKAMHVAIDNLAMVPEHLLVDGNRYKGDGIPFTVVVDGDALCFSIAAASIVAKVTRDRIMADYDTRHPGYGFARHKGYATREHREAISKMGYCEIHRRSFEVKTQREPRW